MSIQFLNTGSFPDNAKLTFGTGSDLQIYHDGSNSLINNTTGHLYIYQKADDSNISFFNDNGSGGYNYSFTVDGSGNAMTVQYCAGSCDAACPATVENLFFSENSEGSGNNKYLEIYNASSETVDLSLYAYPSTGNGSDGTYEYWNAFSDVATVAAGDVYVICHGDAVWGACSNGVNTSESSCVNPVSYDT